jgi:hypothetical protein
MESDSGAGLEMRGRMFDESSEAAEPRPFDRAKLVAIGGVFTVSGISALVYQVAWQRLLALHSGAGIYSVAMIVAAFLGGLGIGSALGARWSRGMGPRRALRIFAVIELGVGLFALASPFLYYDLLYLKAPALYAHWWLAAPLHFLMRERSASCTAGTCSAPPSVRSSLPGS